MAKCCSVFAIHEMVGVVAVRHAAALVIYAATTLNDWHFAIAEKQGVFYHSAAANFVEYRKW